MALSVTDFFFNIPIYSPILIEKEDESVLLQLFDKTKGNPFVGYNPSDKIDSTFVVITDLLFTDRKFLDHGGIGKIEIKCKRTETEFSYFILWQPTINKLIKIGQYPSVADFHMHEVKQYSKLLPKEKLREFTKGIGLAANGVGIGSFVYLRRIFEYLILDAYNKAIKDNAIVEADYQRARMDQKIDLLHQYLPTFLVENKGLYSILSLGIHELNEETCLAHFDTLRLGIEIILDEKLDEIRKIEKITLAKQKLATVRSEIKK